MRKAENVYLTVLTAKNWTALSLNLVWRSCFNIDTVIQVHNVPSKTVSTYLLFSSSFLLLLTVSAPCTEASLLQSSSQVFSCPISFSLEAYSLRNCTKYENSTRWRLKSWLIMLLRTTHPLDIRTGAQVFYRSTSKSTSNSTEHITWIMRMEKDEKLEL